jgi:hypothetical protein
MSGFKALSNKLEELFTVILPGGQAIETKILKRIIGELC